MPITRFKGCFFKTRTLQLKNICTMNAYQEYCSRRAMLFKGCFFKTRTLQLKNSCTMNSIKDTAVDGRCPSQDLNVVSLKLGHSEKCMYHELFKDLKVIS